ncbi:MAG: glycosyltransferase [Pedosphaera sp.]|nr:glycosyltransferase [Pedosphaera sp.]
MDPQGQLSEDYRTCGFCVPASREEGLGFSVLEALASEVPAIAAAVGGLRETIKGGRNGLDAPSRKRDGPGRVH